MDSNTSPDVPTPDTGTGSSWYGQREFILRALILVLLFGAISWGVYGRTRSYRFVWDDTYFVVRNPALRSAHLLPSYFTDAATMAAPGWAESFRVYRPLRNVSYLLDYSLVGLDPGWWHIHNVLLHTINALLVMLAGWYLLGSKKHYLWPAAIGGLVFLLHPLQTEAVAWVKCRDDLLMGLFALSGAVLLLRAPDPLTVRRRIGLAAAHGLACLAKVQALPVLPAMILASSRRTMDRSRWRAFLLLMLLGVLYLVWRHHILGRTGQTQPLAGNMIATLLRMGPVLTEYLRLVLAPGNLLADYVHLLDLPPPGAVTLAAHWLLIFLLTVLVCRYAWYERALRVACVWSVAAMLAVLNIVPMMQYMAERFMYLPLAGYAWGVAWLAGRTTGRRRTAVYGILIVYLSALAWASMQRLPVWRDAISLHSATVRDAPYPAWRPRRNLLAAWIDAGQYDAAHDLARELADRALHDESLQTRGRAEVVRARAVLLMHGGAEDEDVLYWLDHVRRLDPSYAEAWIDEAVWHARLGHFTKALPLLDHALTLDPGNAGALYNRGLVYRDLGRRDQAYTDLQASLAVEPRVQTYTSLAAMYWQDGELARAVETYATGLRHFPRHQEMQRWHDEGLRRLQNAARP